MSVCIRPLPESYRKISPRLRPVHPPIFQDCGPGGPSKADIALARELFELLDDESKEWYGNCSFLKAKKTTRTSKKPLRRTRSK